jgi:hypothetical protein
MGFFSLSNQISLRATARYNKKKPKNQLNRFFSIKTAFLSLKFLVFRLMIEWLFIAKKFIVCQCGTNCYLIQTFASKRVLMMKKPSWVAPEAFHHGV